MMLEFNSLRTQFSQILVLLVFLTAFSGIGYAQKKIKLTKNKTQKVMILEEGMRISYSTITGLVTKKGTLTKVDKTFCLIGEKKIDYDDLSSIGRKRSGSGFLQFICGFFGGGAIISSLSPAPTPQCQGCQTESSVDTGAVIAGVAGGVALIAIGINSGIRNSPKDVTQKWKLEVVE